MSAYSLLFKISYCATLGRTNLKLFIEMVKLVCEPRTSCKTQDKRSPMTQVGMAQTPWAGRRW
jgi:hypothetical protein